MVGPAAPHRNILLTPRSASAKMGKRCGGWRPALRSVRKPRGNHYMPESDVLANQKTILANQKTIVANQKIIVGNQKTIQKNQGAILKNQGSLAKILANQKQIIALLKK